MCVHMAIAATPRAVVEAMPQASAASMVAVVAEAAAVPVAATPPAAVGAVPRTGVEVASVAHTGAMAEATAVVVAVSAMSIAAALTAPLAPTVALLPPNSNGSPCCDETRDRCRKHSEGRTGASLKPRRLGGEQNLPGSGGGDGLADRMVGDERNWSRSLWR